MNITECVLDSALNSSYLIFTVPFSPIPRSHRWTFPYSKVEAAYTTALEGVAERTNLLGAESAGEQKAATSTRTERTVMQSFMVSAEEKLSHS